jgi:hypothetical protein
MTTTTSIKIFDCNRPGLLAEHGIENGFITNRLRRALDAIGLQSIAIIGPANVLPTTSDVGALTDRDRLVAILAKGSLSLAKSLATAAGGKLSKKPDRNHKSPGEDIDEMFAGGATHGITFGRLSLVPVEFQLMLSAAEEKQYRTVLGNVFVHEVGHALSGHPADVDHATGGVMKAVIHDTDPALSYTAAFQTLIGAGGRH